MPLDCDDYHKWDLEENSSTYQDAAEKMLEPVLRAGHTPQALAKMIASCNESARDEHGGDEELILVVIEEILETTKVAAAKILNKIKLERDLELFPEGHLFQGSFKYERFPNANFEGRFSIEMKSVLSSFKLSVLQEGAERGVAISDFDIIKDSEIVLFDYKEEKTLEIKCADQDEVEKVKRYLEALVKNCLRSRKKHRVKINPKQQKINSLQAQIGEINEQLAAMGNGYVTDPEKCYEMDRLFTKKFYLEDKINWLKTPKGFAALR